MHASRPILSVIILLAVVHALVGQGLVVLCSDMTEAHLAFELTTADTCPVKHAADECDEEQLHFDDPANHPDVDPCTDTLVQLSHYNMDRNAEPSLSLQPVASHPAISTTDLFVDVPAARQDDVDPLPAVSPNSSISSTVLLI